MWLLYWLGRLVKGWLSAKDDKPPPLLTTDKVLQQEYDYLHGRPKTSDGSATRRPDDDPTGPAPPLTKDEAEALERGGNGSVRRNGASQEMESALAEERKYLFGTEPPAVASAATSDTKLKALFARYKSSTGGAKS